MVLGSQLPSPSHPLSSFIPFDFLHRRKKIFFFRKEIFTVLSQVSLIHPLSPQIAFMCRVMFFNPSPPCPPLSRTSEINNPPYPKWRDIKHRLCILSSTPAGISLFFSASCRELGEKFKKLNLKNHLKIKLISNFFLVKALSLLAYWEDQDLLITTPHT